MNHMKKFVPLLILTLCAGLASLSADAAPRLVPKPPEIKAKSYILMDFNSGRVLAEDQSNRRVEPASLTKMMTAYATFYALQTGSINLSDQVKVSEKAWRMEGSKMFIEVNSMVAVEDLLKGMIVQSGNDASVALAEYVAGSEDAFVVLMNEHARNLGMTGTQFKNATGMPENGHYTTANDMALLAQALIRDFPDFYPWYSIRQFTYNNIQQANRNRLLWSNKYVDGIKTGHTESAGFCLVTSALKDKMRLISVVIGTRNENAREKESQKLLTYGFRFFETHQLYAANEPLTKVPIFKGSIDELPLGVNRDLYVTIPRGRYKKLSASLNVDKTIIAPAAKHEQYGTVDITLEGQAYARRRLVALEDVKSGGVFQRLIDEIRLIFQ